MAHQRCRKNNSLWSHLPSTLPLPYTLSFTSHGNDDEICGLDNLSLHREATDFFGDLLIPHVENIVKNNAAKPFDEKERAKVGDIVAGAVITSNGKLTPKYEYISE